MGWVERFEEGGFERHRQRHIRMFRVFGVFRGHRVFLCNNHSDNVEKRIYARSIEMFTQSQSYSNI